jgi:uncharacterized lipoprotein YddW (UPF0748 family)
MTVTLKNIFLIVLVLLPGLLWAQSPKREFRGMWIATVNSLDWPSKAGGKAEKQQQELIAMLDTLERLNFNAVIFQIRPAADAFYRSRTEPWSVYLTGEQGKAPDKNWDPLAFMVTECHKRGMELHAWMNPFRISQKLTDKLSAQNIASQHPDWVVTYAGKQYLDPGIPAVRDYLKMIVKEVVQNYDIDAVHFDDYFYPYPVANTPFPDTLSFKNFGTGYAPDEIENWRRANVDSIIFSLGQTIKKIKPTVKFGISPFGVWKNYDTDHTGSVTSAGTTNFDHLFADVIRWQQMGWIDYLMPQIYWEIGHPTVDYITLANWWGERGFAGHVYIGHALYKLEEGSSEAWKSEREMPEQIRITRKLKDVDGSAFFRMKYLDKNLYGFKDQLNEDLYMHKALVPRMEWIDSIAPVAPKKIVAPGLFKKKKIEIRYPKGQQPSGDLLGYVYYTSPKKNSLDVGNPKNILKFSPNSEVKISDLPLPLKKRAYIWVTAIDRLHNESAPVGKVRVRKRKSQDDIFCANQQDAFHD